MGPQLKCGSDGSNIKTIDIIPREFESKFIIHTQWSPKREKSEKKKVRLA